MSERLSPFLLSACRYFCSELPSKNKPHPFRTALFRIEGRNFSQVGFWKLCGRAVSESLIPKQMNIKVS